MQQLTVAVKSLSCPHQSRLRLLVWMRRLWKLTAPTPSCLVLPRLQSLSLAGTAVLLRRYNIINEWCHAPEITATK